jgi:hypothetical protein
MSLGANFSISDIESMIPWEREVYHLQHINWEKEQKEKDGRKNNQIQ